MKSITSTVHRNAEAGRPPVSAAAGGGRFGRLARSPLGWMLTGCVGVALIADVTATAPGPLPVLGAVAAVAVYWLVMRYQAGRPTPEIARRGAVRETLLGMALGLAFLLSSILLIALFGGFSFSGAGNGFSVVVSAVVSVAGGAMTEELMFRGLALQALQRLYGGRAALAVTALFFGLAHFFNPAATVWSAVAIALEAGVLLGVAFLWRRSIWFVFGLHFAWNLTEQLFGVPVSGHPVQGLLITHVHGPAWLTGGGFGLEASVLPVLISLGLSGWMAVRARRGRDGAPAAGAAR